MLLRSTDGFEASKKCCYYEVMKPIFWGLRLLFKFPYHISPQGEFRVHYSSFWMIYSIALYAVLSYPSTLILIEVYEKYSATCTLDSLLMVLAVYGFTSFHIISLNACLFESKALATYLNSWKEFQEEYWRITGEELKPALGGWVRTFAILIIPSIFIYVTIEGSVFDDLMLIKLIVLLTIYLSAIFYLYFFVFTCYYAIDVARSLKKQLIKTLLSTISDTRAESLANLRVLWVKLSDLTQEVGGAIARTLMMKIIVFVLMIIISSYNTLMTVFSWSSDGNPTPFTASAFVYYFLIATINLYFISASAHAATDHVGISFALDLFKVDMSSMDLETKFNILEFIHTVYLNTPIIDMGGFFKINRQLFLSIIRSLLLNLYHRSKSLLLELNSFMT